MSDFVTWFLQSHDMLFAIILLFLPYVLGNAAVGPADITVERVEKCGEDKLGTKVEFSMKKLNRTHMGLDVFADLPFDLDSTVAVNLTAAKWGDGGWKPNAFDYYDDDMCKLVSTTIEEKFKQITRLFNHEEKCPIKAGIYEIKDYAFDTELGVPVMYGKFRIDLILRKDGVDFLCIRGYDNQQPKKPMMG